MTILFNAQELHVVAVPPQDVERAAGILAVSLREKRFKDAKLDITKAILNKQNFLTEALPNDEASSFVLRVPAFDTPYPLNRRDGYQDAGYLELSPSTTTLRIGLIHSVISPYPSGSALLGHAILHAQQEDYLRIGLLASYQESADWFQSTALFECANPFQYPPKEMKLFKNNYANAMKNIENTKGLSFDCR